MERETLLQSINSYKEQLAKVEIAISSSENDAQKEELYDLQSNLTQLIALTQESLSRIPDGLDDEFALFMSEMEKDGVIDNKKSENSSDIVNELKSLEGMKCRAPHQHQWGDTMYHNAIVCSVVSPDEHKSFDEIEVKIMFINPTHEEMLPCPYLMESDCKFSDDQCKYSHGEIVLFSSLQEYVEPKFDLLTINSLVLAKQSNKLWSRAIIKRMNDNKCLVKFDSNHKDLELELHNMVPLDCVKEDEISDESDCDTEDVINMSLINTPSAEALGHWEKHTKGVGSKIMEKMGYVVGTGLGRFSDGRTEPVSAICLPPGKSLDHCMNLREKAGGDKDLFNVEKKLKRLQRKQEERNIKAYEREKKKVNVFQFLNKTLVNSCNDESAGTSKSKHRLEIKKETVRKLNVASLQIDEDIKRVERDLCRIRESLGRHLDVNSQMHKNLQLKLSSKVNELQMLKAKAVNISCEQKLRSDKKKLTIF